MCNTGCEMILRGAFIVLEGLDRSGKSTQAHKLHEYFNKAGLKSCIRRFPDREEKVSGKILDDFLKNSKDVNESKEAFHLIFSANRWLVAPKIREELASGLNLIVDRYSYSGIAYSLSKGLDKQWVCQSEVGLPKPDLVLFLDIDPENAEMRCGFGDEVMERTDFQKLVYSNMNTIFDPSIWQRINAFQNVDAVHREITEKVDKLLLGYDAQKPSKNFSLIDFGL